MPRNSQVIKGANQITVEWQDGNQDGAIVALDGGNTTTTPGGQSRQEG